MKAVKPFVNLPTPDPLAPGPFAFADSDRVRGILEQAGFRAIAFTSLETTLCFGEAPTLAEAAAQMLKIGPVAALLADLDEATRAKAMRAATEAVAPFYRDGRLAPPVAIWLVGATIA
jgi:hypothetical protein